MDIMIMVHILVVDMILKFMINQMKITIHMQILGIHIFIQIMFIILNKHGKNFQEENILKQNNIKCINYLHLND